MSITGRLMKVAGSDKVAVMATSVARSATRVALGIAVARLGDVDAFASFVLLMGVETIASTLSNAAITMPLITAASGAAPQEAAGLLSAANSACRTLTAIGVPVAVAGASLMTDASTTTMLGFTVFLTASMLASPRLATLNTAFRSRRILAAEIAFAAGTASTLGLLMLATHSSQSSPWIALAIGALLRCVTMGREDRTRDGLPDIAAAQRLKAIAMPMVIGSAGVTIASRAQPFVLQAMLGAAHVGTFGAAQTMVGPIRLFSSSISGVLRPRLALHARRGDLRAFRSVLMQAWAPIAAMGFTLTAAAAVLGDHLAGLVFGPSLADAGACLAALSLYAALEAIGACSAVAVQSLSDDGSRIVTRIRLIVAAVGLALLLPAASLGGAMGSACSLAVTEAIFVGLILRRLAVVFKARSEVTSQAQASSIS